MPPVSSSTLTCPFTNTLSSASIYFLLSLYTFGKTITSTVPTRSSNLRKAIFCPWRVFFTLHSAIMPPTITRSSSFTFGIPVSSSGMKSAVVQVTFLFRSPSYSSRGCPLAYIPSTSFSIAKSSLFVYSPTSGIVISSGFSSGANISKSDICPEISVFRSELTLSIMSPYTSIICLRVSPKLSNAPDLIKLSTVRLLTSFPESLDIKSLISLNLPPFARSSTIASITGLPRLFIAESPYLMLESEAAVKVPSPSLISGGRISIPILRQVTIYCATFVVLSSTLVISAAINSTG